MTLKHIFAAIFVAALWGSNFSAIKISFDAFGPFTQLTLRFICASIPFLPFVKRPNCSWKLVGQFALYNWVLQLSFISLALHYGLPAGLSSLLMQSQNLFTLGLSCCLFGYRPTVGEVVGLGISLLGIGLIGLHVGGSNGYFWPFVLVLLAALSVSKCNLIFKNRSEPIHMLSLVVWSCLLPIVPMGVMALQFEGVDGIVSSFHLMTPRTIGAVLYTVIFPTLVGYTIFASLLKKYEPVHVVPFTLLIPIFAIGTSHVMTGEVVTWVHMLAGTFIIGGLMINQLHKRHVRRRAIRQARRGAVVAPSSPQRAA